MNEAAHSASCQDMLPDFKNTSWGRTIFEHQFGADPYTILKIEDGFALHKVFETYQICEKHSDLVLQSAVTPKHTPITVPEVVFSQTLQIIGT